MASYHHHHPHAESAPDADETEEIVHKNLESPEDVKEFMDKIHSSVVGSPDEDADFWESAPLDAVAMRDFIQLDTVEQKTKFAGEMTRETLLKVREHILCELAFGKPLDEDNKDEILFLLDQIKLIQVILYKTV